MQQHTIGTRTSRLAAGLLLAVSLVFMVDAPTAVDASARRTSTPIMGFSRLSAEELATWYRSKNITGARPAVSVEALARLFIEEGRTEGVAGDVAFVQAMVETGWLRHSERVPPRYFNYAGIGAVDSGTGANRFPNARTGVRAQIQHLRAYADPTANCTNFARPTVTPRCRWVLPKGKARNWEQMGRGNWATDPAYASKIITLYDQALVHSDKPIVK